MENYLLKIMPVQLKHLCLAIKLPLLLDETHEPRYLLFKWWLKNKVNNLLKKIWQKTEKEIKY